MANDNQNQAGGEGRQSDLDEQKKGETGQQGQQPQAGGEQMIGGQQGQQSEFGQQGQAETGTAEPSAQQGETGSGQEGGFVGTQREESGEYLQEGETHHAGFAEQGQGATDQPESGDVERGGERSDNRSTDIEGSSGA